MRIPKEGGWLFGGVPPSLLPIPGKEKEEKLGRKQTL